MHSLLTIRHEWTKDFIRDQRAWFQANCPNVTEAELTAYATGATQAVTHILGLLKLHNLLQNVTK